MANEITVTNTLQVLKRNTAGDRSLVQYVAQPSFYKADMAGASGPYVGTVLVQRTYTIIDTSRVGGGGVWRFMNQDESDMVEVGIWSPAAGDFLPLFELLPGESTVLRISRFIGQGQTPNTGTGTSDTNTNYLAAKASGSTVDLLIEAFPV